MNCTNFDIHKCIIMSIRIPRFAFLASPRPLVIIVTSIFNIYILPSTTFEQLPYAYACPSETCDKQVWHTTIAAFQNNARANDLFLEPFDYLVDTLKRFYKLQADLDHCIRLGFGNADCRLLLHTLLHHGTPHGLAPTPGLIL